MKCRAWPSPSRRRTCRGRESALHLLDNRNVFIRHACKEFFPPGTQPFLQQAGSIIGRTLTTPDGEVTGKIKEVRVFDDGIVAVLESGDQVVVGGGVTIS